VLYKEGDEEKAIKKVGKGKINITKGVDVHDDM
jgi:hypothetical protein